MSYLLWIILLLTSLSLSIRNFLPAIVVAGEDGRESNAEGEPNSFAIAAYLPDYRINAYIEQQLQMWSSTTNVDDVSSPIITPILTDLILFSIQPHSKGFVGGCCLQDDHYQLVKGYRTQFYNYTASSLNLWITVGGAGRSNAFQDICKDEKRKHRFIVSITKLCQKHSVQGIDLDFYQPKTVEERNSYDIFILEAIDIWHSQHLKVSMTLHPSRTNLPSRIAQKVDRIHLMAYDMISRSGDTTTIYHASIENTEKFINAILISNNLPHKILLGIPAYGRQLQDPSKAMTFNELYHDIVLENTDDVDFDTMYSWKGYEWDSPTRIRDKIQLAKSKGLGGIFFWEIGQDKCTTKHPQGILLEAAATAVYSRPVSSTKSTNDEL